ncbi:MAG TPA: ATP-binding protein [Acetivibrio sp.]|uniref:ATP-binding protein n=1 Tax=Acetivibrio sp. TaxID=1872092 RepID=UPI002B55C33B|nr:ATP-binding protein [Acetivibrio sp.]HOM02556.1 ATP-binding protein [Acetivibrio sp.]
MEILSYKLNAHIPFDKDSIEMFLSSCEEVISNMTSDEKTVFKLKSATHELLINSLEHGYKKSAGNVSFFIEKHEHTIQLEVSDEGVGFDTSSLNLEKDHSSLNTIKGRGWGLFILKKLCDNIQITSSPLKGTKVTVSINY